MAIIGFITITLAGLAALVSGIGSVWIELCFSGRCDIAVKIYAAFIISIGCALLYFAYCNCPFILTVVG